MSKIILASNSPRRREILEQMGIEFDVCPAKGEEVITSSNPSEVVVELSEQKALEVAAGYASFVEGKKDLATKSDMLVIGSDTLVALDGKILTKPKDEEDAFNILRSLSGKKHSVFTGVTVVIIDESGKSGKVSFYEETRVEVAELTDEEIRRYIRTGEPMDKAGAYGIQGAFGIHIRGIEGDYYNVVGLPVSALYEKLKSIGIDLYLW